MAETFAWERKEGESDKAFAAFSCYLGLSGERSHAEVAKRLDKSTVQIWKWSSKWEWNARVAAHTDRMAVVEREMSEVAVRAKAPIWAKRQQDLRETAWAVHEECIAAARQGLAALMAKGGRMTPGDVARLLEVATKLGCMSSGLAMERVEVTGEDGGPLKIEMMAALEKVYGRGAVASGQVVDVEVSEAAKALPAVASGADGSPVAPGTQG